MPGFNTIFKGEYWMNGNHMMPAEVKDLKDFLSDTGLTEMRAVGRFYT